MKTREVSLRVLLIENNQSAAEQIRAAITAPNSGPFVVDWACGLKEALDQLKTERYSAILLNLFLPDSRDIESFDKIFSAAPDIPILILSDISNEDLAIEAVGRGAQDYILRSHFEAYSLSRALHNAIERKNVMDELYAEKDRALVTLNSIGDAVLCTDIAGCITYLNLAAEAMMGWNRKEVIGRPLTEAFNIVDGATRKTARDPLEMAIRQNRTVGLTMNCILIRRDGTELAIEDSAAPIHDRGGSIVGAVIVFHDVSAAKAMSLQMTHRAHHDLVTGLPNRLLLNDRISQAIVLAHRQRRSIAVMFLDLDHFKNINDSLGHGVGDKLLLSIAQRLKKGLRESDTVSRQGGDEFVILLGEISNPDSAAMSATKLLHALSAPHLIDDRILHISSSIGISIYPEDGENAETLIQNADMAMYHAKESGRNNFQFFAAEMNVKAVERQNLESSLRSALENNEFVLHYQPKVNLSTGKITGCEALIRWKPNDSELICPAKFISVAEDSGLITQIGRWVLREACRQARAWQDAGLPALPIAVNVSAVEFHSKDFIKSLLAILSETGLDAQYIELELTERVLMKDAESTKTTLKELKRIGIRLAVDDFGTGYSSLSYLREFPIDVLKIDRSFIQNITASSEDSILVNVIINMGNSLKYVVVAEGIETQEQGDYLQSHQCAEGQGYLFSRPLAAAQFSHLIEADIQVYKQQENSRQQQIQQL